MTNKYPTQELLDETMHTLINRDILCNQTVIVNEMLKLDNENLPQWDDIENSMYHLHIDTEEQITAFQYYELDDINKTVYNDEPEHKEIMQWYSVSQSLADRLFALGQPVIRLPNIGYWWGICNFGIPLEDQPVLKTIVMELSQ